MPANRWGRIRAVRARRPLSFPSPRAREMERRSGGFRRVPNWLFHKQIEQRRRKGEQWAALECWCSMDDDQFRHGKLIGSRAYAKQWGRDRTWVLRFMQAYRDEYGLPDPPRGRPSDRNDAPDDPTAVRFIDQAIEQGSRANAPPWGAPEPRKPATPPARAPTTSESQRRRDPQRPLRDA